MGMIARCVPHDQLMSEAYDVARAIARGPQHAIKYSKVSSCVLA